MHTTRSVILGGLVICASALMPLRAHAATISFSPEATRALVGDDFVVDIILDSAGEEINAVNLKILYPGVISIKEISRIGSNITLWVSDPSFDRSSIQLSGGVPKGITSDHALIARLVLEAKAIGTGTLALQPGSVVLRNDGAGSTTSIATTPAQIIIAARPPQTTPIVVDSTALRTTKDNGNPVPFGIQVTTVPTIYNGKYFAAFTTSDNRSGVDHYELKEGSGTFRTARSPYLLSDQNLRTVVRARAYDALGNFTEAVWPGVFKRIWWWLLGLIRLR